MLQPSTHTENHNTTTTIKKLPPYNLLHWLQLIVYGSVLLYFGKQIFVPLSFALLISFILYPVCRWLEAKGTSRHIAIIIAITLLFILVLSVVTLLVSQFISFLDDWPVLQLKLTESFSSLSHLLIEVFGFTKEQQQQILDRISDQSGSNILEFIKKMISISSFSLIMLVLIPVYAVLILYYRNYWMKILGRLFQNEKKEDLLKMITLTIRTYYNFIKGMIIVYITVGTLNSIGLLFLGIPHAILFGFIASVLTFIPYLGIIVGSLLPITIAWITYDSLWYPLGIVGIFTFVQYLEANIIFPIAVSSRLNVNTFVMLLAIFTGGILWGVSGMILFVPFVGIIKLIADHNPKWKTVSMILGISDENKTQKT